MDHGAAYLYIHVHQLLRVDVLQGTHHPSTTSCDSRLAHLKLCGNTTTVLGHDDRGVLSRWVTSGLVPFSQAERDQLAQLGLLLLEQPGRI